MTENDQAEKERRFTQLITYLFDIPLPHTEDDWSPAPEIESSAEWPAVGPQVVAAVPLLPHLPRLSPGLASLLSSARVKRELAEAAIDSFFANVYPHWPLFSRAQLDALYSTPNNDGADALMAAVILWGTRFSDAPLLDSDRKECAAFLRNEHARQHSTSTITTTGPTTGTNAKEVQTHSDLLRLRRAGASRIVHWAHARTIALFDARRALVLPSLNHAAACLLLHIYTPQWRTKSASSPLPSTSVSPSMETLRTAASRALVTAHTQGYTRTYLLAAVEHLRSLGLHLSDGTSKLPAERHATAVLCWWHCRLVDTVDGLMYRTSPIIQPADFTVPPPPVPGRTWAELSYASVQQPDPNASESAALQRWEAWVASLTDLAQLRSLLYTTIWSPRAMHQGVKLSALEAAVSAVHGWKARHLSAVGVPPAWPSSWDLATVFQACFIEVVYAATWIALSCVVNQQGISLPPGTQFAERQARAEELRALIRRAAIELAGRIAMAAQTMAAQRYLQVDPGLMRAGFFHAGARLVGGGRNAQVRDIISALTQCADAAHDTDHYAVKLEELMRTFAQLGAQRSSSPSSPTNADAVDHARHASSDPAADPDHDSGDEEGEATGDPSMDQGDHHPDQPSDATTDAAGQGDQPPTEPIMDTSSDPPTCGPSSGSSSGPSDPSGSGEPISTEPTTTHSPSQPSGPLSAPSVPTVPTENGTPPKQRGFALYRKAPWVQTSPPPAKSVARSSSVPTVQAATQVQGTTTTFTTDAQQPQES